MKSRMERYESINNDSSNRVSNNQELYDSINKTEISKIRTYSNAKIIDANTKEIDLNKIKNYIEKISQEENVTRRTLVPDTGLYRKEEKILEETKDYDINSVLEKARMGRETDYEKEKYKKLRDTQFDILNKIKIYENSEETEPEIEFNTEEKTLIDLINTVVENKNKNDLLSCLQEGPEESKTDSLKKELEKTNSFITTKPEQKTDFYKQELIDTNEIQKQKEEIKKSVIEELKKTMEIFPEKIEEAKNLDNSFYTSSMNFDKEDFEALDTEENQKSGNGRVVFVIISLIIIIAIVGIVIANFVFDLGLFDSFLVK